MNTLPENKVQRFDLSVGQKELWYIHSMEGAAQSAYNEHLIYRLEGFLSVATLQNALKLLIEKHDLLRVSFAKDDEGNLLQCVHAHAPLDFTVKEALNAEALDQAISKELKQPFHLHQPSLMRVCLFKTSASQFVLVIVIHHIIIDGTSFALLVKDLNALYNQLLKGESVQIEPCALTYFDHVNQEKTDFASPSYQDKVKQVAQSLAGYSHLNFLTTPIAQGKTDLFTGDRVYFQLDEALCAKTHMFAQSQRSTVFHVLYAVYCMVLSQYTRSQDLLIGVPFANREHDRDQQVLGYYINTIPVRVPLQTEDTFLNLLSRVKSTIFSSLCDQEVAFEHLASHLHFGRKAPGQHPLIQTLFVWGNTDKLQLNFSGVSAQIEQQHFAQTAKFDLSLFMLEDNKKTVNAYFEYRDAVFERDLIENIVRGMMVLLNQVVERPTDLLSTFSLLDQTQLLRMKEKFFNAKLDRVVTQSLAGLFSESAQHHGHRIGLLFEDKQYDYATIEAKSNQWASYIRYQYQQLHGSELPADTLIGLYVDRCEDMIFGILGILKAGAAYVPVDPQYPAERINYIVNHSQASLLLTHKKQDLSQLDFAADRIVLMDDENVLSSPHFVDQKPTHVINPQSLAYVLYTSGSTGKPKGVGVSHENVICLFESLKREFDITHNDVWSLFHTFCFDISVWEIWGAFLFGGALLVVPYALSRDPRQFYQLVKSQGVTVLTQTASAFQMFINEDLQTAEKLEHLRYVGFVGESLKVSILRPWVEKYGTQKPRLANLYGITETTVYTNCKFVEQEDIDKGRDNIGWPLHEFSMCVMNDHLQWCPVGIVGEICIGGRGLSRGYLYRDDLTEQKFIPDPYAEFLGIAANACLYRTGDLGRWLEDGSIEYLGRKDFQIKLRGFRIELGEIESALGSYAGISHTAVLLKGEQESAYLAAYFTSKESMVDKTLLNNHLATCLPEYMIPKTYTQLDSFPMTVNGKINRDALHALEDKLSLTQDIVPLQTELEQQIAVLWSTLLKVDVAHIGRNSNFFDLGGNSLLVVKLLTQVAKQLAIDMPLSQFVAMPILSTLTSRDGHGSTQQLWQRIKQDIHLDEAIQPLSTQNEQIRNSRAIFITGVTGFLGAHLLHQLLQNSDATLYCLVRAASVDAALLKIKQTLDKYQCNDTMNVNRIIPVLGDLAQHQLGLSTFDYDKICQEVDTIYHVGALVHHIFDYQTLYPANVQSVIGCLNIATCHKNKALHFVSTLATEFISPLEKLKGQTHSELDLNGYLNSKWVAEQLLKAANQRGIQTTVYRPGNIIAGERGVYEAHANHTLLRLKGMLQLGKGYLSEGDQVEMMPVDLLAKAIVEIAHKPQLFAYNLNNSQTISWIDYLICAINKGYRFEFLKDPSVWNQLLDQLEENNAFYKLASLYKVDLSGVAQESSDVTPIKPDYLIDVPNYETLIKLQFDSLIASGFLAAPVLVDEAINALA